MASLSLFLYHFPLPGGRDRVPNQDGGRAGGSALGRLGLQDWIVHDSFGVLAYLLQKYRSF